MKTLIHFVKLMLTTSKLIMFQKFCNVLEFFYFDKCHLPNKNIYILISDIFKYNNVKLMDESHQICFTKIQT